MKNFTKKEKLGVFALSIIILFSICSISGVLPMASLFGGDDSNVFGGHITTTETSQSGSTTTSFIESTIDHIDLTLTNRNGFTDSKALWIKPTGTTLTDYQKKIVIDYDSSMQADFDDVRFFQDGTQLDYWLESKTDSTQATFWLKVPTIDGNEGANIDIKYGNPNLDSESDGNDVFDFYFGANSQEEFDSKFNTKTGGDYSFSNGIMSIDDIDGTSDSFRSIDTITHDTIVDFKINPKTTKYISFGLATIDMTDYAMLDIVPTDYASTYRFISKTSDTSSHTDSKITMTDEIGKYSLLYQSNSVKIYKDDVLKVTKTNNIPSISLPITLALVNDPNDSEMDVDYIYSRQYTPIEPEYFILDNIPASQTKYKEITIDPSTDGTLYFYQVFLDDIPHATAMQDDFDDLRFTYDGVPIPHFIDSFSSGTSADVYVLVPVVDSSTGATIKMYYGDATATSKSDGHNTMILYDDFAGTSFNPQWLYVSNMAVDNGRVYGTSTNKPDIIANIYNNNKDFIIDAKLKSNYVNSATYQHAMILNEGSTSKIQYLYMPLDSADDFIYFDSAHVSHSIYSGFSASTWYNIKRIIHTNGVYDAYVYDESNSLLGSAIGKVGESK